MPDTSDALATLKTDLDAARQVYETDIWRGSAKSLAASYSYLNAIGIDVRLTVPLYGLMCGLADASKGVKNPHIPRVKYYGGRTANLRDTVELSTAAAIVTLLRRAGLTLPASLNKVVAATGNRFEPNQIKNFRREMTSKRSRVSPQAKAIYNGLLASAKDLGTPGQAAEVGVEMLKATMSKVAQPPSPSTPD